MGFLSDIAPTIIGGALGLLGDKKDRESQSQANDQNAALQREFAQQGVRWKVADAKAAGINPLFALGAQTISPTASFQATASGRGDSFRNMGQDLTRAIQATRTQKERDDALYDLQLENARLQNQGLALRNNAIASQMAVARQGGGNPAFPSANDSGVVVVEPSARTSTRRGDPALEAAASPAVKEFVNKDGSITLWPSTDAKNAVEDNIVYELEHIYRNRIAPQLRNAGRGYKYAAQAYGRFLANRPRYFK